ncbi:MAG: hypothetical protein ACR2OV_00100 [Hyphomicrobiaceae bacterium]
MPTSCKRTSETKTKLPLTGHGFTLHGLRLNQCSATYYPTKLLAVFVDNMLEIDPHQQEQSDENFPLYVLECDGSIPPAGELCSNCPHRRPQERDT